MSDETTSTETDPQLTFKVKTSGDANHTITMAETATVLDLKNKLAGGEYENIPVERQRLIYSGRVMKNEEPLSTYKIKAGNTIHMVKSAPSNAAQTPAAAASPSGAPRAAAGVPTNMAAGTANNPLAGLTGARYAGHMGLPGMEMFGADGGMGAPPTDDMLASMLDDPNMRQTMNEALSNPDLVNMMIQNTPALRNMPGAREMLQSPMMREMLTNPDSIRQAAAMRRSMAGAGGAGGFPAPGVTDTTPAGAAGTTPGAGAGAGTGANVPPFNPFAFGGAAGANPFAQLFGGPGAAGNTPPAPASAGQSPAAGVDPNAPNPFASLFGGAGAGGAPGANPLFPNMPAPTQEQMRQTLEMLQNGGFDLFGGAGGFPGGAGGGAAAAPAAPADTRPPEERYADQLRQLNDMGFFDFDRNVEALRRSGGSVQGAIEQLLS
ncbi:deubiquitination-protection dph1 protein [Rutstroemia sp. NJR-2017a BBW]|nr:deubiquitination-protection dph1 protein [Rutstroemia sp. NJR-2017a BBW]